MRSSTTEKHVPEARNLPATPEQVTDFGNYDEANYDDDEDEKSGSKPASKVATASNVVTTTPAAVNNDLIYFSPSLAMN